MTHKKNLPLFSRFLLPSLTMLLASLPLAHSQAQTFTCSQPAPAQTLGYLPKIISESSGIEVSRLYNRHYHINDGGSRNTFYVTEKNGNILQKVKVPGELGDTEDMSLFSCGPGDCLLLAGVGDNHSTRETVRFTVLSELAEFPEEVAPLHQFSARYEDGPRDSEAVAVHPNGDIIVITKQYGRISLIAKPARVYRLPAAEWKNLPPGGVGVLKFERELDLSKVQRMSLVLGRLATGLDISSDGKRFVVLTYTHAVEFNFDLSLPLPKPTSEMIEGLDYQRIPLARRIQQEAIAYDEESPGFIYTTENKRFDPFDPEGKPGMIGRVGCQ